MRVLDLGCGPGSITAGLAAAVAPGGKVLGMDADFGQLTATRGFCSTTGVDSSVGLAVGEATALPICDGSIDVAFAHAMFEHLTTPDAVLQELRRVLRPGGELALCSSDWSQARVEPYTPGVAQVLRAYWRLRQQTGSDPFAGGHLPDWVSAAGFTVHTINRVDRTDMSYPELGAYLHHRLATAAHQPAVEADDLAKAATWPADVSGQFTQCWVEVRATR